MFQLETGFDPSAGLDQVEAVARAAEEAGYDGVVGTETTHDPFIALALAARATERVTLTTGIAVAFARSPMTTAMAANDLQLASGGRFVLGLGSQVKAHIERRFSMPWSAPAARMREYVEALHAIWSSWQTGERLNFKGEHYQHTLMTPFFSPGPNPHGSPPIWLAAVGEGMAETAGAVADGVICHPFTTSRYLTEVSLPAMRRGAESTGRSDAALGVALPAFVVLGHDQAEIDAATAGTKKQIAFYASTPAYRPVLELHGWEAAGEQLHGLSTRGAWDEMADVITDDMLDAFAVIGTPTAAAAALHERFDGLVTRLSFDMPYRVAPESVAELVAALR